MIHPNYWGRAAAGILPLCTKTGRLLLTLRSQEVMEPGTWGIPGGRIMDGSWKRDRDTGVVFQEPVESPEDGAIREFREETFYTGRVQLVPLYIFRDRLSGFAFHNFLGLVSKEFPERQVEESWECDEARWVTLDEALAIEPKHFGLRALLADKASLETIMGRIRMIKPKYTRNPDLVRGGRQVVDEALKDVYWKNTVTPIRTVFAGQIRLRQLDDVGGYKVWVVDGSLIRHYVEIEFALGGNHGRYSFIPYNEVWIEDTGNELDMMATIMHEVIEVELMRKSGLDYDAAHEIASSREIALRTKLAEGLA